MNARDALKNLRTSDVETGFGSIKRVAAEFDGWVCRHCGEARNGKSAPDDKAKPACKSKSGSHKWQKV